MDAAHPIVVAWTWTLEHVALAIGLACSAIAAFVVVALGRRGRAKRAPITPR